MTFDDIKYNPKQGNFINTLAKNPRWEKITQTPFKPHITTITLLCAPLLLIATLSIICPIAAIIVSLATITIVVFIIKPETPYYLLTILHHFGFFFFNFYMPHEKVTFIASELFMIIIPLLWLLSRSINTATPYFGTVWDIPLLLFWGLSLLSLVWTVDLLNGSMQLLVLSFSFIVYFVVTLSTINNHNKLNIVIWLVIILGILDSIICLLSVFSKYSYPDYIQSQLINYKNFEITLFFNFLGKRGHAFNHPITTAFFLNFALMLSFGKFLTTKGNKKIAISIITFLMLTAHLTTLSKAPLLALIGGVVFMFYFIRPTRKAFFLAITILLIVLITSFVLANITDLKNTMRYTTHQVTGYDENSSTTSRMNWWMQSIEKSVENYGFGVGIGGIQKYLRPPAPHSHNAFVGAFGDLGFIGLGLLLLIYIFAFKSYFDTFIKCRNEYYRRILFTYIGGFITLIITALLTLNYTMDSLWWYMGFGYVIINIAKKVPPDFMDNDLPFFKEKKSICTI